MNNQRHESTNQNHSKLELSLARQASLIAALKWVYAGPPDDLFWDILDKIEDDNKAATSAALMGIRA